MLQLTADARDAMFAHAISEQPNEACGMFSAANGMEVVDYFHPMRNAAGSSTVFVLDGQELLDLERAVEETKRSLIGIMHSHITTSAYPSPTDVQDSARFDPLGTYRHVIVSLRHAEPVLRCFTIVGEAVTEEPVVVTDGDDDLQDEGGAIAVAAAVPLRSVT